jgi:hypothetical protein
MALAITLAVSWAAAVLPADKLQAIQGARAALSLRKGMTEAQVEQTLGPTFYMLRTSSLGSFRDYREYRLRIVFEYGKLAAIYRLGIEKLPSGDWRHNRLQQLPLR